MNHRIRITLAALMTLLSLGFFSSTATADGDTDCTATPDALTCQKQAADAACAAHGPNSMECLSARNVYLEHYASNRDSLVASLMSSIAQIRETVATYSSEFAKVEKRAQRQAATIARLRERLHAR